MKQTAQALSVACVLAVSVAVGPVATTSAVPPTSISISASGDLLAHNTLYQRAAVAGGYNFAPLLDGLKPLLTADLNICHLETPLTTGTPRNYPSFATPFQLASAIKAVGFDGCSVASNHSLDRGSAGVFTTLEKMHKVGLKTAGTRKSLKDTNVAWYLIKGVKIAQLAYAYGFNGMSPPKDMPWLVNKINTNKILRDAARARSQGAKLIIVSLHWGTEYSDQPNSMQLTIADALTKSPNIDAIIGHHAHVIEYAKIINGKPVIFGLGNLWSGQGPWAHQPKGQHGVIVKLNFKVSTSGVVFSGGSYIPTLTLGTSWTVGAATSVRRADAKAEACRSIKDSAAHLSQVLSGPTKCP